MQKAGAAMPATPATDTLMHSTHAHVVHKIQNDPRGLPHVTVETVQATALLATTS
jgi:hypothetical protein